MEMLLSRKLQHRKEFILDFSPAMPGNLRELRKQGHPETNLPIHTIPNFSNFFLFQKKSLIGSIPVSRSNSPRRMP